MNFSPLGANRRAKTKFAWLAPSVLAFCPGPEHGRGWLTLSPAVPDQPLHEVYVEIAEDGLPVIRSKNGPVITSEMVREIEGSTP